MIALARLNVKDDVTIDEAIKAVVEKYPHFAQSTTKPPAPKFGNPAQPTGENAIDEREKAFRKRMGLQSK